MKTQDTDKQSKDTSQLALSTIPIFNNTIMLTNKIYPLFAKLFNGNLLEFSDIVFFASCDYNVFVLVELVIALAYLFCILIVAAANADIEGVRNVQF